jgi:hypothetical protein
MATVPEFELEQKISDFVHFVREYATHKKGGFKVSAKRDNALLICTRNEVTLDFKV